jgi:hypothetical protein
MKFKLFLLTIFSIHCSIAVSQNVSFSPRLISFRNTRVSPTFNIQLNLPGTFIGKKPDDYKIIGGGGASIGLGLDIYSPNSIIGIYSEVNYCISSFGIQNNQSLIDSFKVSYFVIPLYLKFRLGAKDSPKHFWLALGGSINFPLACERNLFDGSALLWTDKDEKQMVSIYKSLSTIIAYEAFKNEDYSGLRIVIFLSADYKLDNILNTSYTGLDEGDLTTGNPKSIGKYDEIIFKDIVYCFGLKLLFKTRSKSKSQ